MISYFILVLQFVCLSVWVGGGLVVLMVVAPQVFSSLSRSQAGAVMAPILRKFGSALLFSLVVLTISLSIQLLVLSGLAALKLRIAMSLSSLSILFTVYERYVLAPHMEHLRTTIDMEVDHDGRKLFRRLHVRSMVLFGVNLFLGFAVVMTLIAPLYRP